MHALEDSYTHPYGSSFCHVLYIMHPYVAKETIFHFGLMGDRAGVISDIMQIPTRPAGPLPYVPITPVPCNLIAATQPNM